MIRKTVKKTTTNEKIQAFIKKSKIPKEFMGSSRKMVTRGVVIGLFVAFIPMPMQMAAVLLFMPFIKFNVPIGVAMVWITNPFTMPFIYVAEYYTGSFLLGMQIDEVEMSLSWFNAHLGDIFIPFYFGALFYSALLSFLSYYLLTHLWKRSVHQEKNSSRKS